MRSEWNGCAIRDFPILALVSALLFCPGHLAGQVLMRGDGTVRIHNTDLAVFEAKEPRKDLPWW
jgi:hypothetical protein